MWARSTSPSLLAGDERLPEPVFFAYMAPMPDGLEDAAIGSAEAAWSAPLDEFLCATRTSGAPLSTWRAARLPREHLHRGRVALRVGPAAPDPAVTGGRGRAAATAARQKAAGFAPSA
ncbi:MAG: DUF5996 family protein [Gaiellaceae bacterium]